MPISRYSPKQPTQLFSLDQLCGGKIGRIFACRVIDYFGAVFLKIEEISQMFWLLFSAVKVMH
jgi:hypothetical protein